MSKPRIIGELVIVAYKAVSNRQQFLYCVKKKVI